MAAKYDVDATSASAVASTTKLSDKDIVAGLNACFEAMEGKKPNRYVIERVRDLCENQYHVRGRFSLFVVRSNQKNSMTNASSVLLG